VLLLSTQNNTCESTKKARMSAGHRLSANWLNLQSGGSTHATGPLFVELYQVTGPQLAHGIGTRVVTSFAYSNSQQAYAIY